MASVRGMSVPPEHRPPAVPRSGVPLTLGIRPRGTPDHPLLAGLLDDVTGHRRKGLVHGVPVVAASRLVGDRGAVAAGGVAVRGVAVDLDVDPAVLPAELLSGPGAVRHEVTPAHADLREVLAIDLPLVVFLESSPWLLADLGSVLAAGHRPGLRAGVDVGAVSDFLAVLAHAEVAFVARAHDDAGVLSLLAATVASLRGDDARAAWRAPDAAALSTLSDEAGAAVRTVLGSVEVPDPVGVAAGLVAAGFAAAGHSAEGIHPWDLPADPP